MIKKKSVLFLSANDFKEKSIQVIRKTPEAYVAAGWDVTYIVARDDSKTGNYFYEKEINPEGVKVVRIKTPFTKLKDNSKSKTLKRIVSKLANYLVIIKLAFKAYKEIKVHSYDVIYGYEKQGVLAGALCNLIFRNKFIYIHRFMGTWLTSFYKENRRLKLLLHIDAILALKLDSDLLIMTDDGTQGDKALQITKSKSLKNYRFWINGVDEQKLYIDKNTDFRKKLGLTNEKIFLSISRLNSWKRVDRVINVISLIKEKNFKYFIVGDGDRREELEKLVEEKNLKNNIVFVGAIPNNDVKKYLNIADVFFSLYDLSNVGNPLLEAIRANKIIFTLNNGDTNKWIQHKENGFIYDIDNNLYENMAKDIDMLLKDSILRDQIVENIRTTEKEKLWTWEERMKAEVLEVEKLIDEK